MRFTNWADFFNMGGHGFYVWLSYGVTFILLLACIILGWRRHQILIDRIRRIAEQKNNASHS